MDLVLGGKVAIVTGAGSGIGRGSAVALAAAGAKVAVQDIDRAGADQTVAIIRDSGGQAISVSGDVCQTQDVVRNIQETIDQFGRLDVLHANAGIAQYEVLEALSDEMMQRIINVNLIGILLYARHSIPYLAKSGSSSVIMTSSVQATHSLPGCVVYSATKAGIIAAARTLALEVGKSGIRVNALLPGTIDTPMLERDLAGMNIEEAEGFIERVKAANALNRIGSVEEIGSAVVFLASSAASYVTGTALVVDGGFTAVKRF